MRHVTIPRVLLGMLGLCCFVTTAWSQDQDQGGLIVIQATNKPLPSLQQAANLVRSNPPDPNRLFNEVPNFNLGIDSRTQVGNENIGQDPLLRPFNPSMATSVLTQFDGSDNVDQGINVTPPDTDGDVSVDRFVQMINLLTTVFDKSGNILGGGPFFSSAFWQGFGGLCETNNNGDPIVLYDETSGRWLVSQFAFNSTSSPPWLQCIAVSQTSDPLGAYNRYAYNFASFGFPDYPKHGIVTDEITMMANLFNPFFVGTFIGVADKNCMYAGNPACTLVGTNLGFNEFGFLAGDLDDAAGTAGDVPALFGTAMTANGLFDIWEIVPDFVTPSNTTVSRIERVPIASFDSDICTATRERCVPHPGSGDDLETLSGRLMHRLQIRDFGTHLSMVTSHTIDADAAPSGGNGRTGIRWYELRSTDGGANWSLHQEGTHAPTDGLDRWMPSIAMNEGGDIGVGYMVSSASMPVEIRVTGQTAANSGTGTFDGTEEACRNGVAGADWSGRSGDYSATTVDPVTDTFWHTNEFGRSNAFRGWGTAVCEFQVNGGPVNQAPVVTITAPADGASFIEGTSISFAGTATDNEDGTISANLTWTSSLDGAIGSGASFSAVLSVGVHTVTASVTDSGGLPGSDAITVTVLANQSPVVTITSPADGASFTQGDNITFTGTATDNEDGTISANLTWSSNLDGAIGAGASFSTSSLSVGAHTITASVTDSGGLPGSDVITVNIMVPGNQAPVVVISSPADGASFPDGTSITFTGTATDNEDGTISANLAWTSSLDGAIGAGASFNATLSVGMHTVTASVTDSGGLPGSDAITVTVTPVGGGGPTLETVVVAGVSSGSWTPVNLVNTYTNLVAVCGAVYAANTVPQVVRMRNAAGSSFELMVQNPGDATALSGEPVHCLAMEAGSGQLPDGRLIEAQKYTSTVTDENNSWTGQSQSYLQGYTSPVVLGQVMSYNDTDWSVFWNRGSSQGSPPSSAALSTGKHVGEDPDNTRANEEVGFIVIESGTGTVNGVPYEATLGADVVMGVGDPAGSTTYAFSQGFSSVPAVAVVTMAAMDGNNGGWGMLTGSSPLSTTGVEVIVDEDQVQDTERRHTTEQIAYLVFEQNVNITLSVPQATLAARDSQLAATLAGQTTAVPEAFALTDVYPNPFNHNVTIRYGVPEAAHVRIMVYNMLGQHVQTLVDGTQSEGYRSVVWDGQPANGSALSSGVYLVRLEAGSTIQTRTVLYVR